MTRIIDVTGQTFGRWTVLGPAPKPVRAVAGNYYHQAWWQCRCACGTLRPVIGRHLRIGISRSCGCLRIESNKSRKSAA